MVSLRPGPVVSRPPKPVRKHEKATPGRRCHGESDAARCRVATANCAYGGFDGELRSERCSGPVGDDRGRGDAARRGHRRPRFIRGTTLVYPVLGSPITQVKAPMLYNALFASTGVDAVVVPIEVAAADYPALLKGLFRGRNVPGAFVTIPHKPATVELLDDCSDAVRIAGAAMRSSAAPTEPSTASSSTASASSALPNAPASTSPARTASWSVPGVPVPAIAAALAAGGAARVRLHDTRADACARPRRALAAPLRRRYGRGREPRLDGFDLVVNATPLGMEPTDALPVDLGQITPNMLIGEIVMKREVTPLVDAARARGCQVVLGREMLREQMPLYLRFLRLASRVYRLIPGTDRRAPVAAILPRESSQDLSSKVAWNANHGGSSMSYRKFLGAAALPLFAGIASAAFPERELTGVIMWGAGGATDVVARALNAARRSRAGQEDRAGQQVPAAPARSRPTSSSTRRPTATRCSTAPRIRSSTRCWRSPTSATRSSTR